MIYQISSKDNKKIKEIMEIRRRMNTKDNNYFIVEGMHLLSMAFENNAVVSVFTLKPIENLKVDQYIINETILKKISSLQTPRELVAICRKKARKEVTGEKVLYLDGIQDPGNLGTILRTSLAFGYKDVILSPTCVSQYNSKVISSTQGALFALNIVNGDINTLLSLKSNKYQLIATSLKDSQPVERIKLSKKHILIMGNEGQGVSNDVLEISDYKTIIPIENMESLNVAIATSIMMYILSNKER